MVAKPAPIFRPSPAPRRLDKLLGDSFRLWLCSLRPGFLPALLYSLLSQLALLPWIWHNPVWIETGRLQQWRQRPPDLSLALQEWPALQLGLEPLTLSLTVLGHVLALPCLLRLMQRQLLIARAQAPGPGQDLPRLLQRLPAALLASLGYLMLNLLALAPLWLALALAFGSDGRVPAEPLGPLLLILTGLLLSAAPLAWISIAACFFCPPILLDRSGPRQALRESLRLVRGHWGLSALQLNLALLAFLGLYSTLSTLPLLLTGSAALLMHGWPALLHTGWLAWGQLLSAPLLALSLPLLTASYVLCFEELRQRHPPEPASSRT